LRHYLHKIDYPGPFSIRSRLETMASGSTSPKIFKHITGMVRKAAHGLPVRKRIRTGQKAGAGIAEPVHIHDKGFLIRPVVLVHWLTRISKIAASGIRTAAIYNM